MSIFSDISRIPFFFSHFLHGMDRTHIQSTFILIKEIQIYGTGNNEV